MGKMIYWELDYVFSCILWGLFLMLIYDVLRIERRVWKRGSIWVSIEDILYWSFAAIGTFQLFYRQDNGVIRWFAIAATFLMMLLMNRFISGWAVPLISRILCIPIRFLERIERKVVGFFQKTVKIFIKKLKLKRKKDTIKRQEKKIERQKKQQKKEAEQQKKQQEKEAEQQKKQQEKEAEQQKKQQEKEAKQQKKQQKREAEQQKRQQEREAKQQKRQRKKEAKQQKKKIKRQER